jgi:MFS family permease
MEQNFKKISKSSRNSMMIVLLFGSFVALLAETFLNNAIPTIMNSLNVSQTTAQWLTTAYLLVVGLMIPISAWIFESFQLKSSYLTMMSIFLIGSLICLIAPNFECLLLGRLIEAVAAGSLMPFTQNVILLLFPKEQRGMAMGITGLIIGFCPAIGPTISGLILKYFSWRMLFLTLSIASLLVMVAAISVVKNITIPKSRVTDFVFFC